MEAVIASQTKNADSYDRMPYLGHSFDSAHSNCLATIASLHGMQPAPVPCCRVLEIGCGDGGNLIPMAYHWPDSRFVGFDLSRQAIARGRAMAAELGLRNIVLHRLDIMDVGPDLGQFDYIIAHGVYSWVPAPVREKILSLLRDHLAPNGVAYLSYNAYPGSYFRDLTRKMMLYRVRGMSDPEMQVREARALLAAVAELTSDRDVYDLVLRSQFDRVNNVRDTLLYHDDLNEHACAFWLYEVVEAAERHGLQFLSDAGYSILNLPSAEEPVIKLIEQIPEADILAREQHLDFIRGRSFRETLLCHKEAPLRRRILPQCVRDYHLAGQVLPASDDIDPAQAGVAQFTMGQYGRLSTDHRVLKAALLHLGAVWPQSVAFLQLLEAAYARLGLAASPSGEQCQADLEALTTMVFRAFCASQIELHLYPPRLIATVSARPQASLLARTQVANGELVTNLRHTSIRINDQTARRFLTLVDGTRTADQLACDLRSSMAMSPAGAADGQEASAAISPQVIEHQLHAIARLGLLVA